ncbi:hypothetical protein [Nostoc sp.]|uniref:hypothetical protein n=1 Tax=Nostoc sp. TaxID=1180 RepID=UPI002FF74500
MRYGDRTYLNLVSSSLCDYICDQFLALFTKSSDRKSEKLHPLKICGEAALRGGFPLQATAEPEGCVTLA